MSKALNFLSGEFPDNCETTRANLELGNIETGTRVNPIIHITPEDVKEANASFEGFGCY